MKLSLLKFFRVCFVLVLLIFIGIHFYYDYQGIIFRTKWAVQNHTDGKVFNDRLYKQRLDITSLLDDRIEGSRGLFVKFTKTPTPSSVIDIATFGMINYRYYPLPVHSIYDTDLKKCDYLLIETLLNAKYFLQQQGEADNFIKNETKEEYTLFTRKNVKSDGKVSSTPNKKSLSYVMFGLFLIICALLLPLFPGAGTLKVLLPNLKINSFIYFTASLLAGHFLLSFITFFLLIIGFKMNPVLFISVYLILSSFICLILTIRKNTGPDHKVTEGLNYSLFYKYFNLLIKRSINNFKKNRFYIIIATGSFLIFFIMMIIDGMSMAVASWPGVAVWAFKAKILCITGEIGNLYTNPETIYIHPEYPLGYPIMLAWCWSVAGGIDDWLIKLVPIFWSAISYILLLKLFNYGTERKSMVSVLLASLIVSSTIWFMITFTMYAETLLICQTLTGFYCVKCFLDAVDSEKKQSFLILSMFMFSMSCWWKTEGLIYSLTMAFALFLISWKEIKIAISSDKYRFIFFTTVAGVLGLLPLFMSKFIFRTASIDFSITGMPAFFSEAWVKKSGKILQVFTETTFYNIRGLGIIVSILAVYIVLLVIYRKRSIRKPKSLYIGVMVGVLSAFLLLFAFMFSVMPLWWHVRAMERVLIIPEVIILISIFPWIRREFLCRKKIKA